MYRGLQEEGDWLLNTFTSVLRRLQRFLRNSIKTVMSTVYIYTHIYIHFIKIFIIYKKKTRRECCLKSFLTATVRASPLLHLVFWVFIFLYSYFIHLSAHSFICMYVFIYFVFIYFVCYRHRPHLHPSVVYLAIWGISKPARGQWCFFVLFSQHRNTLNTRISKRGNCRSRFTSAETRAIVCQWYGHVLCGNNEQTVSKQISRPCVCLTVSGQKKCAIGASRTWVLL